MEILLLGLWLDLDLDDGELYRKFEYLVHIFVIAIDIGKNNTWIIMCFYDIAMREN